MPPALSIVIPTHDTRDLTLACLHSLPPETPSLHQVVVVDDGSGDGTAEAIQRQVPGVEVVRQEPARGFTAAANVGLGRARGAIIFLLNSDTEVKPGCLERLIEAFREDRALGVAGAALEYPGGDPQWSGGREPTLPWLFALASGAGGLVGRIPGLRRLLRVSGHRTTDVDWVTGAAMAFRRQVWEQVGPMDEGFQFYGQDLDFCLRAGEAGWKVRVLAEARVLHHHGGTVSHSSAKSVGRQDPTLLWSDLLRWSRESRGERWARKALSALVWGARARLAARWLAGCLQQPGEEREEWARHSRSYRRALTSLLRSRHHTSEK